MRIIHNLYGVRRLVNLLEFIALGALGALVASSIVALRHFVDTPQPLESALPGNAHIYRWRHGHIFYKTLGNEDAPPLVLLHAPTLGGSAYEMRKIMGALAQDYHVYALDLLGFGLSDHPRMNFSAETYIALCHDFLTEEVAQPAMLVASELSCNYAVSVAKRFPSTCSRLVLISPLELFGFGNEQAPNPWSDLLRQPGIRFLFYAILSTRTVLRWAFGRQRSPHLGQISASDVDYLYATTHQFGAEHAVLARLTGELAVDVPFDTLQQPTLVIWGARALNNARLLPGQQHLSAHTEMALIQDAGISVHEEYPALAVANILEWSKADKAGTEPRKDVINHAPTGEIEPDNKGVLMAYCVKCKKKTAMQDAKEVTMKNGSPAVKGKCSICGTGQHRIGRLEKENL